MVTTVNGAAGLGTAELPATLSAFEARARATMDPVAYDYCAGGAGAERTIAANRRAFESIEFVPRVMVDVSHVDSSLEVFGQPLGLPVLLAPTAFNRIVHADGELAVAAAAAACGTVMVASTMTSFTIEDIAERAAASLWFQLYAFRDRGFTEALVARAAAAGCRALVLTCDVPRFGIRERDVRNAFVLPESISARNLDSMGASSRWNGGDSFARFNDRMLDSGITPRTVEWIRSLTPLPLVIKGILAPEDAEIAVAAGASAVVVSNHGGRQLDGAMATLRALPRVVQAVGDRCLVFLDGGVRGGGDVLAALALGARAVFIGRPYLWGLALAGEAGVHRVLTLFREELEAAMALAGCPNLAAIAPSLVHARP